MLREQNARNVLWKLSQFEIVKVTTAQWLLRRLFILPLCHLQLPESPARMVS